MPGPLAAAVEDGHAELFDCTFRQRVGLFAAFQAAVTLVAVGSLVAVVDTVDGGEHRSLVALSLCLAVSVFQSVLALIQTIVGGRATRHTNVPVLTQLVELVNAAVLGVSSVALTSRCAASKATAIVAATITAIISGALLYVAWLVGNSERYDPRTGETPRHLTALCVCSSVGWFRVIRMIWTAYCSAWNGCGWRAARVAPARSARSG